MLEAYLGVVFLGLLVIGMVLLFELIWIVIVEDIGDDGNTW